VSVDGSFLAIVTVGKAFGSADDSVRFFPIQEPIAQKDVEEERPSQPGELKLECIAGLYARRRSGH
jgi:hypothetical protein